MSLMNFVSQIPNTPLLILPIIIGIYIYIFSTLVLLHFYDMIIDFIDILHSKHRP
jgi:hypothetical protein